jgi:hypothetical protein
MSPAHEALSHLWPKGVLPLPRRALFLAVLALALVAASSGSSGVTFAPSANPQVTVVFDDNGIKPGNRDAANLIKNSGAFQRSADWVIRSWR